MKEKGEKAKQAHQLHQPKRKGGAKLKATPEVIIPIVQANPNLTTRQIGKLAGCDHSAVVRALQRYGIKQERVEEFKSYRADIFAGLQATVAATLTEEDLKKASVRDRTILLGTLYDKERLERGLSTQNTAVLMASAVLEADRLESERLRNVPAAEESVTLTVTPDGDTTVNGRQNK